MEPQQELINRLALHYEVIWPTDSWQDIAGADGAGEYESAAWLFLINAVEQNLPVENSHLNELSGVFHPEEGSDEFYGYIQTLRKRQLTAA